MKAQSNKGLAIFASVVVFLGFVGIFVNINRNKITAQIKEDAINYAAGSGHERL